MTRTIYIDPGTHWNAWLVTGGRALPIGYVDSDTIEIGTLVDLPAHKVKARTHKDGTPVVRADGTESVRDKVRTISPGQRAEVADELLAIAKRFGCARAVVETMGYNWLGKGSDAEKQARAESAKELGKIETLIYDRLHTAGIEVVPVTATRWRARMRPELPARVVGSAIQGRGTELTPIIVRHFDAWPDRANVHERDCGGMALWDTLPPLVPAKARATGTRRPRVGQRAKASPRASRKRALMGEIDLAKYQETDRKRYKRTVGAARREDREAAGCTCRAAGAPMRTVRKPGAHVAGCAQGAALLAAAVVACSCREDATSREGRHRGSCAVRVSLASALAVRCSCRDGEAVRVGGRHAAGCAMHVAKVQAARVCRCGVPFATHVRPVCPG